MDFCNFCCLNTFVWDICFLLNFEVFRYLRVCRRINVRVLNSLILQDIVPFHVVKNSFALSMICNQSILLNVPSIQLLITNYKDLGNTGRNLGC